MRITVTEKTPKPSEWAHKASAWVRAPWQDAIRGDFPDTPSEALDELVLGAAEGDVIVGYDRGGLVEEMHLLVGNRLVRMQDGFETLHVQILLQNMGEAGKRRDEAEAFVAQVSRMSTTQDAMEEAEAMGAELEIDRDHDASNTEALDYLITRARRLQAPELDLDPTEDGAPAMGF